MNAKKIAFLVLLPAALSACSPKFTLQPSDVPSLYGDISTLGTPGAELDAVAEAVVSDVTTAVENRVDAATEAALSKVAAQCAAISAELEKIDAGLGGPAVDSAPSTPPTALQKTGRSFYDMGVQTILGQLQVLIQGKRALFGDAEKERLRAEAVERGTTRRAYLMGFAKAQGCILGSASASSLQTPAQ